jgi:hypothetical protein
MDPRLMESLFSDKDSFFDNIAIQKEMSEEDEEKFKIVLEQLDLISPLEADIIELFLKGIPQAVLGKIFGFTQPNIHYRIQKSIDRLSKMVRITKFTKEELEERLSQYYTGRTLTILVYIYLWSSQSRVATLIGETQGKVRYTLIKSLNEMKHIPDLKDIYDNLSYIKDNISLLRGTHKQESGYKAIY